MNQYMPVRLMTGEGCVAAAGILKNLQNGIAFMDAGRMDEMLRRMFKV